MKVCCKCKIEKSLDEFNGIKRKASRCKECTKVDVKIYRKTDLGKERSKELGKKYRDKNKSRNTANLKKWRKNNPEKIKVQKAEWRSKNRNKLNKLEMDRYWRNWETIRKKQREICKTEEYKEKRKKSPGVTWRRLLSDSLRRLGKRKEGNTVTLLGYSAIELKNHLEKLFLFGMSWENRSEWHIDHIKPVTAFDRETHPSIVNALTNLQPLWRRDNILKSNKY